MKRGRLRLGLLGLLLALLRPGGGAVADDVGFTTLFITLSRVDDAYVDRGRVDAPAMYEAALRAVEQEVPALIFEGDPREGEVTLRVGADRSRVRVGPLSSVEDLAVALRALIEALNAALPADADARAVEYALSNGVLGTLDPHSVLLTPEDLAPMQSDHEGHFGGLGISIRVLDRRLTVTCPLPGTPAEAAGLASGDLITRIGPVSTTNMPIDEAVRRMRGPVGEPVTITIVRGDQPARDVTLVRDTISLQHLEGLYLGDGVAFVRLQRFYRGASADLLKLLDTLERGAGAPIEGLVLDLRSNPGGLLTEASELADLFLDEGDIVSVVGAEADKPEVTWAKARGTRAALRLAVLVGPDSASASEIVAGALQGHDRAVILGARSFGKGSVQNLWPLPGGAGLKMTVAEYLTSGRRSIQSTGVSPDVALRPAWAEGDEVYLAFQDAAFREEDLDGALASRFTAPASPPARVVVYAEERLSPDAPPRDRFDCRGVAELGEDLQVRFAAALVAASETPSGEAMLREGRAALDAVAAPHEARLIEQIEARGLSWAPAPPPSTPRLAVSHEVQGEGGVLVAGEEGVLVVRVRNEGDAPVPRLRGMIRAELGALEGRELLFGTLAPGQEVAYALKVEVGPDIYSLVEEARLQLFAGEGPALLEAPLRVEVREQPVPRFGMGVSLVDDGRPGTRGNGDGLPQPGETLQVAVSVHNLGEAPTGDRWLEPWWHRHNDDRPPDQRAAREGACYVSLYETTGHALFFPEGQGGGSCSGWGEGMPYSGPLMPGEVRRLAFTMEVPGPLTLDAPSGSPRPATAESPVRLQVTVRDQALWESATTELTLWPAEPAPSPAPASRRMVTRGEVVARAAARAESPPLARLEGPVEAEALVGGFWRVALPWGVPGFVAEADLERGGAKGSLAVEEVLAQRPPLVELAAPPDLVTAADTLTLTGRVRDPEGVDHVLVFVNGRKVRVLQPEQPGAEELALALSLPLEPGVNSVRLVARDLGRSEIVRSVAVYREGAAPDKK